MGPLKESDQICERLGIELRAAGIPVDRINVFAVTPAPARPGRAFRWTPGEPVKIGHLTLAFQQSDVYKKPCGRSCAATSSCGAALIRVFQPTTSAVLHGSRRRVLPTMCVCLSCSLAARCMRSAGIDGTVRLQRPAHRAGAAGDSTARPPGEDHGRGAPG